MWMVTTSLVVEAEAWRDASCISLGAKAEPRGLDKIKQIHHETKPPFQVSDGPINDGE